MILKVDFLTDLKRCDKVKNAPEVELNCLAVYSYSQHEINGVQSSNKRVYL